MFNIMSHIANQSHYTRRYRPRHVLAHYAVNQIATLELRSQDIVNAMGYPLKHTMPACERLRHVLSSQYLALDSSYIDKYFSPEAFLIKLFAVLEIPFAPFAEDIEQIKQQVARYQPYQHCQRHSSLNDLDPTYRLLEAEDEQAIAKVEVKRKKSSNA